MSAAGLRRTALPTVDAAFRERARDALGDRTLVWLVTELAIRHDIRVSDSAISRWLGEGRKLSLVYLSALADCLGVNRCWLAFGEGPKYARRKR